MEVREWALPVYTILMQVATGSLLSLWLIRWVAERRYGPALAERMMRIPLLAILLTVVVAIAGSHFHLSRPYLSLLAVLNFRYSWLSREVVFTILFLLSLVGLSYLYWFGHDHGHGYRRLKTGLAWLGIGSGLVSVYCMAMIYLLPAQPMWHSPLTVVSFLVSVLVLGTTAVSVMIVMELKLSEIADVAQVAPRRQIISRTFIWLAAAAGLAALTTLLINLLIIASLRQGDVSALISLDLLLGLYRPLLILRYLTLFAGAGWFAVTAFLVYRSATRNLALTTPVYLSCLLVMISEILGRFLFYATHVRMGI